MKIKTHVLMLLTVYFLKIIKKFSHTFTPNKVYFFKFIFQVTRPKKKIELIVYKYTYSSGH